MSKDSLHEEIQRHAEKYADENYSTGSKDAFVLLVTNAMLIGANIVLERRIEREPQEEEEGST